MRRRTPTSSRPGLPRSASFRLALLGLAALLGPRTTRPVSAQDSTGLRPLAVDDYFRLRRVGDGRLSPDGKWIAYTVTTTDLKEEKSETRLRIVATAGGDPIPMTAPGYSAGSPRWSPDGRYLSFLASKGGDDAKSQVWVLDRRGGDAQPLTEVKQGVDGYEWAPDGRRLALLITDPSVADTAKEKPKTPPPHVIDRLQFKRDYTGYLDRRRTHLYVFDLRDSSLIQITSGDFDDSSPAWSPDGRRIAFVSDRTKEPDGNDDSDIWIVAADNTDRGATLLQLTHNPGPDGSPAWSPDGRSIAFVRDTRPELIWYATNELAVVPAAGGEPRSLTASLDRNVYSPRWSADGRSILFLLEDAGEQLLARVPAAGGKVERTLAGERSVESFDAAAGGAIVTRISLPDRPAEIYALSGREPRRLTHENDALMDSLALGDVRKIRYTSRDGTPIEAFVYTPPGFQRGMRYPLLLRIHGGPVSQFDWGFNFESRLFAANGYVVLNVNPRGSSGYGTEFSRVIWADWGHRDYEDLMAGVDRLIADGIVDPNRMGVGGWSYGGILTDHVITQTDTFKAAISGASEVLYTSNYGHDHYQLQWEKELGLPWRAQQAWDSISPFWKVENIHTPTLIMGGAEDWNVPIVNSEQLYQALKRLGRTTELVVYPGQHHGLSKPSYIKDRYERYLEWYGRYVKGEG